MNEPQTDIYVVIADDANNAEQRTAKAKKQANDDMKRYEKYVNEMHHRLPGSYDKLVRFLERGTCTCHDIQPARHVSSCEAWKEARKLGKGKARRKSTRMNNGDQKHVEQAPCDCSAQGGHCNCQKSDTSVKIFLHEGRRHVHETCTCNYNNIPHHCNTDPMQNVVRIYEIQHPDADVWNIICKRAQYDGKDDEPQHLQWRNKAWKQLLRVHQYDAADPEDFENLKVRLYSRSDIFKEDMIPDIDEESNREFASEQRLRCVPNRPSRVITVSHLSPSIAKLLGAHFDISADFFNRHLPGTEAISGRLTSQLPSSVQIDFDELYESQLEFRDFSPPTEKSPQSVAKLGHKLIKKSIQKHCLFQVGWDHFPIKRRDFFSSITNIKLKSGYEVLLREQSEEIKNVFQFNLAHRISVFSKPDKYPTTGKCTST
jgi:hypothetical protein